MKSCNRIRELIDEADRPDVLPLEARQHLMLCTDCERFADERVRLRALLGSPPRVTVPMNFDAMLSARIAEVRSRGWLSWLGWPGFLRLGAATAGLVMAALVAQYAGLLSSQPVKMDLSEEGSPASSITAQAGRSAAAFPSEAKPGARAPDYRGQATTVFVNVPRGKGGRGTLATAARIRYREALAGDDMGVVLVRGRNGGLDVPMPTVSLGAQPLLYVSAGRQPARSAGASF
jgi:hypothetical protein